MVLLFVCHKQTSKLQENHQKCSSKLRLSLAWPCTGAHYLWFSDFSWFVRLHTLGAMAPQFSHWFTGRILNVCESHFLFTPMTKIIRVLPLHRRHCRISIAETQTRLQALDRLCLVLKTQYTVHIFPGITQNFYFQSSITQVLHIWERGPRSNVALTLQKMHKRVAEKME